MKKPESLTPVAKKIEMFQSVKLPRDKENIHSCCENGDKCEHVPTTWVRFFK